MTDSLRGEVLAIAGRQTGRSDEELVALLTYEWERAGLAPPDRGPRDYLRGVRDEIVRRAVAERESVGVITGMLADDALRWAAENNLASERYALVLGLLVAWATRAALRPPESDDENGPGTSADD